MAMEAWIVERLISIPIGGVAILASCSGSSTCLWQGGLNTRLNIYRISHEYGIIAAMYHLGFNLNMDILVVARIFDDIRELWPFGGSFLVGNKLLVGCQIDVD